MLPMHIHTKSGLCDKYDPFISAKRQFDDLFSSTMMTASTPNNDFKATSPIMSKSMNAKSPSSPTKTPNVSKSTASFRRTSSLRVPKKTSPVSYMPRYKPTTIQRGISDEGPMSANFVKSEEYDELPVKSHAIIPPDLVPKSPKPLNRSVSAASPPVRKRTNPTNRKHSHNEPVDNSSFRLTKTDSLAAFLEFENDMNEMNEEAFSEQESADNLCTESNQCIDNAGMESEGDEVKCFSDELQIECNNNDIQVDANRNPIDSSNFNICDNLLLSHTTKTNDESACIGCPSDIDTDINIDVSHGSYLSRSTSESSIILNEKHELIENTRNESNDIDKRNPKRQIRYLKDSLLFDNANDDEASTNIATEPNSYEKYSSEANDDRHSIVTRKILPNKGDGHATDKGHILQQSRDIEALFDDFDMEEFISTFNDNEQFPIFKNYKDQQHSACHQKNATPVKMTPSNRNKQDVPGLQRDGNGMRDEYRVTHEIDGNNTNKTSLRRPDVTAEAEKCLEIENEQNKRATIPTKLTQLKDILGNSDIMTQTERELLASVQELSNMCDDSKTLDLTSMEKNNQDNSYMADSIYRWFVHEIIFQSILIN